MRCPRCGADNAAGMKFCGQCGASLGFACPSCGSENPPDHRFCGHCGAPLGLRGFSDSAPPQQALTPRASPTRSAEARGTLPGELKQVTVLFCDIVGSTSLTVQLGSEAMRDLVSSFLEKSLAEIHRYGGSVPQFSGDGFMALFGAPVSQEDHVQRALLASLAILQALGGGEMNLPVRIGINTGPVVFGPLGDALQMDPTAIGDTANLAARLQQAAEPATILLSEATYRFAQSYVRAVSVGRLAIKGKVDPVPAYRLLEVSQGRAALRPSTAARATAFVNRQSDLAILENFLRQVENGHRQVVGIVGEPGIGKSRLLSEFRRRLGEGRVRWIEGRCVSYGTAIPYLLVLDLLRSNCGIVETDTPESIAEKVRSVLQRLGMNADQDSPLLLHLLGLTETAFSPALSNPEAVKTRTFEIFKQISIRLSLERPLILVLEDVHWIDNVSEEFLGFLAENLSGARILMVATYRPGYRPPWLEKSYAGQTPLPPLSRDDSISMVRSVLSADRLIDVVTEEIVAKADGNPFFLEQLVLHAGEALRSDLLVPNTIHDVVMARIDRLPEETKRLLQIAAVVGREFSLRLLSAVWRDTGTLEPQLRELCSLEFLFERVEPDGRHFVFTHALTQEAAYGSLLDRHRRVHHGTIGRALEELYSTRIEEVAEVLAFHFGHSDEVEKAVDYAILAGERAQRRWANSQALSFFEEALRRLDETPDTKFNRLRRVSAVMKQGELKLALGRHAEHLEALQKIRDIVEESDDPPRRASWHYWAGFLQILTGGQATVAIGHCRQAADIASAAAFHELDGFIASCLAQSHIVAGALDAAIEVGKRALSIFETDSNLWWASRALWHLSSASNCLGEWEASLAYCRRALDYGTFLNDLRLKVAGLWRTASTYIQQGDTDQGLQYCEEALALTPIPFDAAAARMVRGYGLVKARHLEVGITELTEVVAWFERSRLSHLRLLATLWLAEGHLARGDRASARPLVEDVLSVTQSQGYVHFEGIAHRLISECLARDGQVEAEEHIETALRILDRTGARNDFAKALVTKAKLRHAKGSDEISRQLLEQAYGIFRNLDTRDEPARVKTALDELQQHDA
jgi:class 3 adenylate cyclase/tetratricopeptide (TPR) repeat protein